MNNQKITKLSTKDREISVLKKGNNYLLERLKQQSNDIFNLTIDIGGRDKRILVLEEDNNVKYAELTKIKSHWLYKFINYFK